MTVFRRKQQNLAHMFADQMPNRQTGTTLCGERAKVTQKMDGTICPRCVSVSVQVANQTLATSRRRGYQVENLAARLEATCGAMSSFDGAVADFSEKFVGLFREAQASIEALDTEDPDVGSATLIIVNRLLAGLAPIHSEMIRLCEHASATGLATMDRLEAEADAIQKAEDERIAMLAEAFGQKAGA